MRPAVADKFLKRMFESGHPTRVLETVRGHQQLFTWLAVALGLVLLAWALAAVGVRTAVAELRLLGPVFPLILFVAAVRYPLQAATWRLAMPADTRDKKRASAAQRATRTERGLRGPASEREGGPGLRELTAACLTGEAFGYLTFAGPFASVPARALLVRDRLPLVQGVAAAAVERLFFVLGAAAMLAAAVVIVGARRVSEGATMASAWLAAGIAAAVIAGIVAGTAAVVRASRRWLRTSPCSIGNVAALFGLSLGQHALVLVEALLVVRGLGIDAPFRRVFVFEALMKLIGVAGAFVPAGVGVYESGSTVVADAIHLGAAVGLGLGLARRIRALVFSSLGLLMLAFHGRQAARSTPARTGP